MSTTSDSPGRKFTLRLQMPADDQALADFLAAQGRRNQGQAVLQLIHMWINEFGTTNVMERCLQGLTLGALGAQGAQGVQPAPAAPVVPAAPATTQSEPEPEPAASGPEPEPAAPAPAVEPAAPAATEQDSASAESADPAAPAAPAEPAAPADDQDESVDDMFGSLRNS